MQPAPAVAPAGAGGGGDAGPNEQPELLPLPPALPWCREGEGPTELRVPGYGSAIPDPDTPLPGTPPNATDGEQAQACAAEAPRPIQALGPHVSPLGVAYWALPPAPQAQPWPAQYEGTVFVGEHG